MQHRISLLLAGLMIGLVFLPFDARADEELKNSIERGKAIAERLCSKCHAVGPTGDSPLAKAPLFREFGKRWPVEVLAESLAEGIVTGHDKMPEFVFEPKEIDDFLNYLRDISSE